MGLGTGLGMGPGLLGTGMGSGMGTPGMPRRTVILTLARTPVRTPLTA